MEALNPILDTLLSLFTLLAGLIAGLWAYTKYVVERGLAPAAELGLDCSIIGEKESKKIIEVTIHLFNKGSSTLVAKDIQLKLKTICKGDALMLYRDEKKFGRLRFDHSLSEDLAGLENNVREAFLLVPHDTFVQPGVDQEYPFVTTIDSDVELLFAHAEFEYAQKPKNVQKMILWISRQLGLIQYSLHHIYKPHTVQRVFNVTDSASTPESFKFGRA